MTLYIIGRNKNSCQRKEVSILLYLVLNQLSLILFNYADEFSLSKKKRKKVPKGYWKDPKNRRKFFLDFAVKSEFDPTITEYWNDVTVAEIVDVQVTLPSSPPFSK